MNEDIRDLLERNKTWAARTTAADPDFFPSLAAIQRPKYLWIGCADSRVPATEIVGLKPGSIFVHRNIANVVVHTDLNCLSVLQYAVEVLKVEHIIVCGHYGCGGVAAAMSTASHGLIDNWLRNVEDVYYAFREEVEAIADPTARIDRMCELNVVVQVQNVSRTTIVQQAWRRGQKLDVHGVVYGLHDGILKDLGHRIASREQLAAIYHID